MKAAVIREAGGPEVLRIEERPIPQPKAGELLVEVKAFGLNRSEMFTRQGHSPNVKFPRVLGIEATGIIVGAPGNGERYPIGSKVATCMGGMGRDFDGGYATHLIVPASQCQIIHTSLPWSIIGALPEMMQTAYGSLKTTLRIQKGDRLLIRGGTTSVGLAAVGLAKKMGASFIASTSRRADREQLVKEAGADAFILDDGEIVKKIKEEEKFDKVLELVGVVTMDDSLACAKQGGIVCITGIVGNKWTLDNWNPMEHIPVGVCLSVYGGWTPAWLSTPIQQMLEQVEAGTLKVNIGRTFSFDQIVEAHRCMDSDEAGGKIVVLTE
ncbi:zinc-binding oxidoreductase [Atractiella rhizophila]|nr:zinc-binding oxidoreductase [Atractiella rhizophila]